MFIIFLLQKLLNISNYGADFILVQFIKRSENYKNYAILMHILCAFGFVYQMYNLNVIYFSYETTTNNNNIYSIKNIVLKDT